MMVRLVLGWRHGKTPGKIDTHGQADAVAARLKREPAGWRRERLLAVKFGLEGQLGLYQIAERLGQPRSVIQRWFDLYHSHSHSGKNSWFLAQNRAFFRLHYTGMRV
jgi:hypothetical protein